MKKKLKNMTKEEMINEFCIKDDNGNAVEPATTLTTEVSLGYTVMAAECGVMTIPDNQRECKWKSKRVQQLAEEFIAGLIVTVLQMISSDLSKVEAILKSAFPDIRIIKTGISQSIAISINLDTGKIECQNGQHRIFHYLPAWLRGELVIHRDTIFNNELLNEKIQMMFAGRNIDTISINDLPDWFSDVLWDIPVVANVIGTKRKFEGAYLFLLENTADAIKEYDKQKSCFCYYDSWNCINDFVLQLQDSGSIQVGSKEYTVKQSELLRAFLPNKRNTLTYYLIRGMSLLTNVSKTSLRWNAKMKTQNEITHKFFGATKACTKELTEKELNKLISLMLKTIKNCYKNDIKRLKNTRTLQSFTIGLLYSYKQLSKKYSKDILDKSALYLVDNIKSTGDYVKYNNAHYIFNKNLLVLEMLEKKCEDELAAARKAVA